MKNRIKSFTVAAALLAVCLPVTTFAQPAPPNDNYTNRIVLSGSDFTFAGAIAGATIETAAETEPYLDPDAWARIPGLDSRLFSATRSIWWEWTAPATTMLNLQIPSFLAPPGHSDGLSIYHASGSASLPDDSLGVALRTLFLTDATNQTLSLPVTAGTTYQIQLAGSTNSANVIYNIRLLATNTPLILTAPKGRTVNSYDSALLFVEASGVPPLTYQWRFSGTNLPGETAAMLSLLNIVTNQAGPYSVVVANSAGAVTSDPALLDVVWLPPPFVPPTPTQSLAVTGIRSNIMHLTLTGLNRGWYSIESSSDLVNWREIQYVGCYTNAFTYLTYPTNVPVALSVTNNAPMQFVRATLDIYTRPITAPDTQICINHLRQIQAAKILFHRATGVNSLYTPSLNELLPFLPQNTIPMCPNDISESFFTSYTLGNVSTDPVCLILPATHILDYTEFH